MSSEIHTICWWHVKRWCRAWTPITELLYIRQMTSHGYFRDNVQLIRRERKRRDSKRWHIRVEDISTALRSAQTGIISTPQQNHAESGGTTPVQSQWYVHGIMLYCNLCVCWQPYHTDYLLAWGVPDIDPLKLNNNIVHSDISCMRWKACMCTQLTNSITVTIYTTTKSYLE